MAISLHPATGTPEAHARNPITRLRFHHYAWGLLACNILVILGGAFVRATMSGDGCGAHWPGCGGAALIPKTTHLATLIESGHRMSTALLLLFTIGLVVWGFLALPRGHAGRKAAVLALILTLVEGGIG